MRKPGEKPEVDEGGDAAEDDILGKLQRDRSLGGLQPMQGRLQSALSKMLERD